MTGTDTQTRRLGYARVSTYGQTLDAQLKQLRGECCTKIYREKANGARPDRRELLKLLKNLTPGDVVTVTRIDRLARSTFDLFGIVKRIVDAKGGIPIIGGAMGRHRHQNRTADDCRPSRLGRRGARPYPHPHGGGPQPSEGTRAAHGPAVEIDGNAEGRGPTTKSRRRDVERTCPQLRRKQEHNFPARGVNPQTSWGMLARNMHEGRMNAPNVAVEIQRRTLPHLGSPEAGIRPVPLA